MTDRIMILCLSIALILISMGFDRLTSQVGENDKRISTLEKKQHPEPITTNECAIFNGGEGYHSCCVMPNGPIHCTYVGEVQ